MIASIRRSASRASAGPDRRLTAAIAIAYGLITYFVMFPTWPTRLRTRIPDGVGDNLLNLWTLHWAGRHVFGSWAHLWNAPIYWPHPNSLAYSDSMLPIAVLHRGIAFVMRSDVLAFNLIYLGAAFGSMFGAFLLARRISGSTAGAFIAGLVYALATPRLVHYEHFQLGFGCFIPFAILLTIRYFDRPSVRRGIALGLAIALLVLSSSYYGLMSLIALLVIVPGLLITGRTVPIRRTLTGLAVGGAVALACVAPVALKYASLEHQASYRRVPDPAFAAHVSDFVRVSPDNRLLGSIAPSSAKATVENYLFPGIVACVLGALGLAALIRRRRALFEARKLETLTLLLSIAASLVLLAFSFGSSHPVAGHSIALPYRLIEGLPGFAGIRATARFVAFPLLTLAVMAAVGFAQGTSALAPRVRVAALAACAAFILVETSIPIQMNIVPDAPSQSAVDYALTRNPAGPVAELPMAAGELGGVVWPAVEVPRMWLARIDGNPRVGGYTGGQPPGLYALAQSLNTGFPSAATITSLTRIGARYVVLRVAGASDIPGSPSFFSQRRAREIVASLPRDRARNLGRFGDAYLIELVTPR